MNYIEKITVIVPIYNVESYLDRCIESIIEQTYDNLEIILVDDGSPDKCPEICDRWAEKDSRIKVIHKKNGGLSDARNAGMKIATGEYIGFVDSDDWIHNDMYRMLYENMHAVGSDISACGVELVSESGECLRILTKTGRWILNNEEAMRAIIEESCLKQPVWYKLYKTKLIKDIDFPVGMYHEDVFWSYRAVAKANKVSIFDDIGYFYVQRSNSIMGECYSEKRLDAVKAKYQRLQYVKKAYPKLMEIAEGDLLFTCIYHGQNALEKLEKEEYTTIFDYLNRVLKDNNLIKFKFKTCTKKQKIWIYCAKISLFYTCKLRNFLKINI